MREITRVKAIKALDAMWEIAFPERAQERVQDWAEANDLCEYWDPEIDDPQPDAIPPGIWDLLQALGVTPHELIEHCHANPKLFDVAPDQSSALTK